MLRKALLLHLLQLEKDLRRCDVNNMISCSLKFKIQKRHCNFDRNIIQTLLFNIFLRYLDIIFAGLYLCIDWRELSGAD